MFVRETIHHEELVLRGPLDAVTPMSMIGPVTLRRQSSAKPPMLLPIGCALLLDVEVLEDLRRSGDAVDSLPVLDACTGGPSNYRLVCYTESAWPSGLVLQEQVCPSCGYPRVRQRAPDLKSITLAAPSAVVGIASTLSVAISDAVRQALLRRGAPVNVFEAVSIRVGE